MANRLLDVWGGGGDDTPIPLNGVTLFRLRLRLKAGPWAIPLLAATGRIKRNYG